MAKIKRYASFYHRKFPKVLPMDEAISVVGLAWAECGGKGLSFYAKYRVLDYLKKEIRWSRMLRLDDPLNMDTTTTYGDILCYLPQAEKVDPVPKKRGAPAYVVKHNVFERISEMGRLR